MLPNPQETVDLVIFTEEILNGKLHFSAVPVKKLNHVHPFEYYLIIVRKNYSHCTKNEVFH